MKLITILLVVLLIVVVYQFYFSKENFESNSDLIYIFLNTDFCGHCKNYINGSPSKAQQLKNMYGDKVIIIDGGIQTSTDIRVPDKDNLMSQWGIRAVPSCFMIKNGVKTQLPNAEIETIKKFFN